MKLIRNLLIVFFALLGYGVATAQEFYARHDSVWIYNSWEALMCQSPDALLVNPDIRAYTPYDIEFDSHDSDTNRMLYDQTLAVAIGDSTWLINSRVLRRLFKGDVKKMDDYVPFYFNAKMVFVEAVPSYSTIGELILSPFYGDPYNSPPELYWFDFERSRIEKITYKNLPTIMDLYPDLVRRFEAMDGKKNREVVHFFFYDFVRRAEQDLRYPYLLDRLPADDE